MGKGDIIFAEMLLPAFGDDLSTWRTIIHRDGQARQVVSLESGPNWGKLESFYWQLSLQELSDIIAAAKRAGFGQFEDSYSHEQLIVTDLDKRRISIRLGDRVKTVVACGASSIAADEDNQDMAAFAEIWNRIHRHAPFPRR